MDNEEKQAGIEESGAGLNPYRRIFLNTLIICGTISVAVILTVSVVVVQVGSLVNRPVDKFLDGIQAEIHAQLPRLTDETLRQIPEISQKIQEEIPNISKELLKVTDEKITKLVDAKVEKILNEKLSYVIEEKMKRFPAPRAK